MSFKSEKSKKKIVATVIAASLLIGNCTFSTNKPMMSAAYDVRIPQEFMEHGNDYSLDNYYIPEDIVTTSTTSAITGTTTMTTTATTTSTSTSTDVVTSTTYSEMTSTTEETTVITEAPTEEVIETPVEVCESTEAPREYVVYKPITHYIHKNTCHWCNSECYEIDSTEGLEARACSECNPDMDIITPYTPPQPTTPTPNTTTTTDTVIAVTDYEYTILCNLVAGEYGSDWVSTYDKGAVVATVIHRVWEGTRWTGGLDGTIYNVIAAPYQYDGKYLSSSYSSKVTESCKEAVTYALNNMSAYDYYTNPDGTSVYMINSFCGDGKYNWFRHS